MGFNEYIEQAIIERERQSLFDAQCARIVMKHNDALQCGSYFQDPSVKFDVDFYRDVMQEKREEAAEFGLKMNVDIEGGCLR